MRNETPEEKERRILACTPILPKQHCSHGLVLSGWCEKCEKARLYWKIPKSPITGYRNDVHG